MKVPVKGMITTVREGRSSLKGATNGDVCSETKKNSRG